MPDHSFLHTLTVDGVSADLRVLHFEGFEGISQLFEFSVTVASPDALDFASVVRKKALLVIRPDYEGSDERNVHGMVSRVEQGSPGVRFFTYRITIVPKAWQLAHRVDNRIFQDKTAPDIIEAVLKGAGLTSGDDYTTKLQATYTQREYCVQYRESDWDFVCRLMEEEGIFYFFEHQEHKHVLLLADKPAAIANVPGASTLVFRPPQGALGAVTHGGHVSRFFYAEEVRPGKVTLRDWNFEKPALSLETNKSAKDNADLEIYDYPGEYDVKSDGDGIAERRLEELRTSEKAGDGDSTSPTFSPGFKFTLSEHPRESFNSEFLITRVEHWGSDPQLDTSTEGGEGTAAHATATAYRNQFDVIPATVVFRPPRLTRRPQIHGVQTAIVVGPQNEEIYTDKHGRVKVQFHWDRIGKNDDKSSCWVRVAQIWASAAFGGMFLPRVKDEVVIAFLEGDPDRPLIVGCVYHGTNVPPYTLPDNKTRSTFKTHSTPQGGDGFNELRFEDKKGSEEIYLHGQKDWTIKIENDKNQVTGHDETLSVGHDRTKTVKHDQTSTVEHDDTFTVNNDQTGTVKNDQKLAVNHDRTVTVDNDHTETVKGNQTLGVEKNQTLTVKQDQTITIDQSVSRTVKKDVTDKIDGKVTETIGGDVGTTISGKRDEKVTGDVTLKSEGKLTITITGDITQTSNGKVDLKGAQKVVVECGSASLTMTPDGKIAIAGGQIEITGNMPVKVSGLNVDIAAQAEANLKGAMIKVEASGVAQLKGGGPAMIDGAMVLIG